MTRPVPPRARLIPRATYRLQLHAGFTLDDARRALPYLAALGVSHVYCSPLLMAQPGSRHGYDVADPTRLNPELGTDADFAAFGRDLEDHRLGLILDIVPNHMGVDGGANPWWNDVLRLGRGSAYADWFDIDWAANDGRLLLPILGAPLDGVIADGAVAIIADGQGGWTLGCYERRLPLNAAGLAHLQARLRDADADAGAGAGAPELVRAVCDLQHYELADWRDAATRINYRRFFDVTGLAALRVDEAVVFEATHALVNGWTRAGLVDGLRIDHPDGLRDPGAYFERLQRAVGDRRGRVYLVAEKILAPAEALPRDWPVDGTTGYDFANLVCGVLVDGSSLGALDATWRDFTGEAVASFADLARQTRLDVLATSFAGELRTLARHALAATGADVFAGGAPDAGALGRAEAVLAELIANFPVYRPYPGDDHREADRAAIATAVAAARRGLDPAAEPGLEAVAAVLAAGLTGEPARDEFVLRFPQLVAPVMAKGVEDTALYRWSRLVSLNDVGGDPDHFGVSVAAFHEAILARARNWPHSMLATSTHDNKRGEYVRLRINAISEDPVQWRALAERWRDALDRELNAAGLLLRPSRSDLYLLFQTLVGSAPVDPETTDPFEAVVALSRADRATVKPDRRPARSSAGWPAAPTEALADYAARIQAYMRKAGREAKHRTSWLDPDDGYEQAVERAIEALFGSGALIRGWLADIRPFGWWGGLNALTATVLKLTVPGVPDIYQGARILDDSLVDPDNRRPVDFAERLPVIEAMARLAEGPAADITASLDAWLAAGDFARLKLWILQRILAWRRVHASLFDTGSYEPLTVTGPLADHLIAFARRDQDRAILVVTTRLYRRAGFRPGPWPVDAPPPGPWTDEAVILPAALGAGRQWTDLLAPGPAETADGPAPALTVSRILARLPVAVLQCELPFPADRASPASALPRSTT